jgi:ATP-dependent Clp protease ATP-binding subunit ClpA
MDSPEQPEADLFARSGGLCEDVLTVETREALGHAVRMARETRWETLRSPHIFMGLLAVPDAGVKNWAERVRFDLGRLLHQFQEQFYQETAEPGPLALHREFLSDNAIRLLRNALSRAREQQRGKITPLDLLITLLTASNSVVAECFEMTGLTAARLTELAVLAEQSCRDPGHPCR